MPHRAALPHRAQPHCAPIFHRLSAPQALVLLAALLLSTLLLTACASQPAKQKAQNTPQSPSLTRADPGYIQWLEKQSLLGAGGELTRVVSGSQLGWRAPSLPPEPHTLLRAADTWISVHPMTLIADGTPSAFAILAQPRAQEVLRRAGMRGLYITSSGGAGAVWAYDRSATLTGDDTIQHGFSEAAGNDDEYNRLRRMADNTRLLLGTDIIPAATGLGPDFFLAARNVRDYPGAYCMVEMPRDVWPMLPECASEWQGRPLTRAMQDQLAQRGLLPAALSRDMIAWARPGGWAVTGEVRGADGTMRRWAYRHAGRFDLPVLHWDDPSATARRILSSSIIQQIGLRGMAMTGFRVEPLTGLDSLPRSAYGDAGHTPALEPAPSAALSLGRETRRYGGWAWQRDRLPLPLLARTLESSADVAEDTVTAPAAEHALLTGDAKPLRAMLDEALRLGIDMRRLVHATPGPDGVDYALPQLASGMMSQGAASAAMREDMQSAMRARAALWANTMPLDATGEVLPVTGAGLAALGAGFSHAEAAQPAARDEIRKGHLALVFFKAMQPGLLMLHGQDVAGVLPLDWRSMADSPDRWDPALAPRGAYALFRTSRTTSLTKQGLPRAPVAYPLPDEQLIDPHSFLNNVHAITAMRERTGIADGRVAARLRTQGRGSVALAVELPGGKGVVLAVTNFGREAVTERLDMAATPRLLELFGSGKPAVDLEQGVALPLEGGRMVLSLGPWETRAILVGNDARAIGAATAAEQPKGPFVPARGASPVPLPAQVPAPPAGAKMQVTPIPPLAPVPELTITLPRSATDPVPQQPTPNASADGPADAPADAPANAVQGAPGTETTLPGPHGAPAAEGTAAPAATQDVPATPQSAPAFPVPTEQPVQPESLAHPAQLAPPAQETVQPVPAPAVTPAPLDSADSALPAPDAGHDSGGAYKAPLRAAPQTLDAPVAVPPAPVVPVTPAVPAPVAPESAAPVIPAPVGTPPPAPEAFAPAPATAEPAAPDTTVQSPPDAYAVPYKSVRRSAPETLEAPGTSGMPVVPDGGAGDYKAPLRVAPETLDGSATPGMPTTGSGSFKSPLRVAPETLDGPVAVPPLPEGPPPAPEPGTTAP